MYKDAHIYFNASKFTWQDYIRPMLRYGTARKAVFGHGARSVFGIDISDKMLAYAKKHNGAESITYQQMALENINGLDKSFDLVTSSLAFDHVADFGNLMKAEETIFPKKRLKWQSQATPPLSLRYRNGAKPTSAD